jgi:hypothetical protein
VIAVHWENFPVPIRKKLHQAAIPERIVNSECHRLRDTKATAQAASDVVISLKINPPLHLDGQHLSAAMKFPNPRAGQWWDPEQQPFMAVGGKLAGMLRPAVPRDVGGRRAGENARLQQLARDKT